MVNGVVVFLGYSNTRFRIVALLKKMFGKLRNAQKKKKYADIKTKYNIVETVSNHPRLGTKAEAILLYIKKIYII